MLAAIGLSALVGTGLAELGLSAADVLAAFRRGGPAEVIRMIGDRPRRTTIVLIGDDGDALSLEV